MRLVFSILYTTRGVRAWLDNKVAAKVSAAEDAEKDTWIVVKVIHFDIENKE